MSFSDLGVPADLVAALSARGIDEPFPVQAATIGDALAGLDLCAKAPTGSGKTLAFGIPLVARVSRSAPKKPHGLVLAPTRELAAQIERELQPLADANGRRLLSVYGGVGYERQKKRLRNGVDILVACPGRLRDLIDQQSVRLDAVEVVVIDEADRMADMGFLPEVRRLLDLTRPDRQTLLFSATLDGDVAKLTAAYQHDPVRHEVAGVDERPADLDHRFVEAEAGERIDLTAETIRAQGATIVFCRTRHGADRLAKQLRTRGIGAEAIHGGLSQGKRDRALAGFARGATEALIATDVAARGIHVDGVACVVHFDPPEDVKAYIHRSGRTGRAGATGTVVSLVARDQRRAAERMQRDLGLIDAPPAPERDARGGQAPGREAAPRRRRNRNRRRTGAPAAR